MAGPGDPLSHALERRLAALAEMVRHVGRRHGLSDADLDEVLQDVRIRLWRALGGGGDSGEKIEAAPSSYVYRTAVTAALDMVRRRRARREEVLDALPDRSAASASPGPTEVLERQELLEALGRSVDQVVETRRPVVRMYLAGYRLNEIAGLLGWTEARTRNLLYRGLAELRARLTEQGIGPEGWA